MSQSNFLSSDEFNKVVEIVALIAWKIELQERQHNPKAFKLAINTINGVAENFASRPLEVKIAQELKIFLARLCDDFTKMEEFTQIRSIKDKLRDVIRLFMTQAEDREVRIFSTFLYRVASRLTEVSGSSFAGMGRRLDSKEAEILIDIRDELPR